LAGVGALKPQRRVSMASLVFAALGVGRLARTNASMHAIELRRALRDRLESYVRLLKARENIAVGLFEYLPRVCARNNNGFDLVRAGPSEASSGKPSLVVPQLE
jgi:hypothetical protein